MFSVRPGGAIDPVLGQHGLNLVPQGFVDNGRVLSWVRIVSVRDLSTIDPVLQHQIEGASGQLPTAIGCPVRQDAPLAPDPRVIKFYLESAHRSELNVAPEDVEDGRSFLVVDDQLSVLHVVSK